MTVEQMLAEIDRLKTENARLLEEAAKREIDFKQQLESVTEMSLGRGRGKALAAVSIGEQGGYHFTGHHA